MPTSSTGCYVGIVPKVSNSNETEHHGRITRRGNKLMRTTVVQCTWIAIRYSGYLNSHYQRIKERRGAGKAIIAAARKLLSIIYDTLKNGWIFEDFPAFEIKHISLLKRDAGSRPGLRLANGQARDPQDAWPP